MLGDESITTLINVQCLLMGSVTGNYVPKLVGQGYHYERALIA